MQSNALRRALVGADGQPVPVSRIEIEILASGFRWNLWSGARRIYSAEAAAGQTCSMLEATEVLMNIEHGIPPAHIIAERN